MALLLGLCVVMGILLSKGLPNLFKMNQRELEQELIFRGEEYGKALRVYRAKHGGYPTKLEDLLKARPRIIRRLWKDPVTNDDFDCVYAVQPGATGVTTGLPISGVRSKSIADSVIKYKNKTIHREWVFLGTEEIFGQGGLGAGQGGSTGSPSGGKGPPDASGGKGEPGPKKE